MVYMKLKLTWNIISLKLGDLPKNDGEIIIGVKDEIQQALYQYQQYKDDKLQ